MSVFVFVLGIGACSLDEPPSERVAPLRNEKAFKGCVALHAERVRVINVSAHHHVLTVEAGDILKIEAHRESPQMECPAWDNDFVVGRARPQVRRLRPVTEHCAGFAGDLHPVFNFIERGVGIADVDDLGLHFDGLAWNQVISDDLPNPKPWAVRNAKFALGDVGG